MDPRDQRTEKDYFEIIGDDQGIFGCMGLLACEDVCPKQLPLQDQLGILRQKMGTTAIRLFIKRYAPPGLGQKIIDLLPRSLRGGEKSG